VPSLEDIYPDFSMPDAGGDKGTLHSYIPVYSEYVTADTRSLLEVGVWEGHSLAMWEKYLPGARVEGIDVNLRRVKYPVTVHHGNATVRADVDRLIGDTVWDVIIDDGSHKVRDQVATFDLLWSKVSDGGKYFVEDVAGDAELHALTKHLESVGVSFVVWDLRSMKGRFDDILVMVEK